MRYAACVLIAFAIGFCLAAPAQAIISDADALAVYVKVAKALDIKADPGQAKVAPEIISTGFGAAISKGKRVSSEMLTVVVDERGSKIVNAINETVWHQANVRGEQAQQQCKELIPTKSYMEVLQAAERLCAALGQSLGADLKPVGIRFDPKTGVWKVAWLRYIGGYRFDEESVVVNFDDVTGKLAIYHNSATTVTCETRVKISIQQATNAAKSHMAKLLPWLVAGDPFDAVQKGEPQLQVVYANYKMIQVPEGPPGPPKQPPPPRQPPTPRLVYNFSFNPTYKGSERVRRVLGPVNIWVDAETGEIAGGL